MTKLSDCWTLVYQNGKAVHAFSFDDEAEANKAKLSVEESDGVAWLNEDDSIAGHHDIKWLHLVQGTYIEKD